MSPRRGLAILGLALIATGGALAVIASSSLPPLDGRRVSTAIGAAGDNALGRAIAPLASAHPQASGIYVLTDSLDAFAARMLLARTAQRSLDVQYYIWRADLTGTLLFAALQEAADRGVRVRLLLDDNNPASLDPILAGLAAHPNIEVRLFNPFAMRWPKWIGYLTDFSRLNRRMHNKSFTADSQATIIGGRNVGDEYFAASDGIVFADIDALAIGPVVKDVAHDFDRYWASGSSYPVDRIVKPGAPLRFESDAAAKPYLEAIRNAGFMRDFLAGRLEFDWATTRLVSDDPAKALGAGPLEMPVADRFEAILGNPAKSFDLISSYFAPTNEGSEALIDMARRGVQISVLTNSFEANDITAAHAGYAKYRKALLQAGVKLYELRRLSSGVERHKIARIGGSSGSSESSLHAKTFSVDGTRVFIGSFNFDARSVNLNTEMGLVIDSPALAQRVDQAFDRRIPEQSYEVRLAPTGELYWIERKEGALLRHDKEPGTSAWQRAAMSIFEQLPVDPLL